MSLDRLLLHIDGVAKNPSSADELITLLAERHEIYHGKSERDVDRIRGYILSKFSDISGPDQLSLFIREELEFGRLPFGVAGAALALRRHSDFMPELIEPLRSASNRFQVQDFSFVLETFDYSPMLTDRTSVLAEIEETLSTYSDKPCCASTLSLEQQEIAPNTKAVIKYLDDIELEDQNGRVTTFGEARSNLPTFLVFFYTRCGNPEKCSLTISKLADLSRAVDRAGLSQHLNLFAISYDGAFDTPPRLGKFGRDRGLEFTERCCMFRVLSEFETLVGSLDLGVGFGPTTVNRHRLDSLILDDEGSLSQEFRRKAWTVDDVLDQLAQLT